MNKKYLIGFVALAFALSMNYKYATNDYGILQNALLTHAQASNSSSSNSSNSSSSSNLNEKCWELPNNHNGQNPSLYCTKEGKPSGCNLKKFIDANGNVVNKDGEAGAGFTYTGITISGVKELCPKKGVGCTVYSCKETQ